MLEFCWCDDDVLRCAPPSSSCVLSEARTPGCFWDAAQRSGRTPATTFLSGLLPVQMLSFQAGMEGAGWHSCPGERWWYRTARTAAPTNHQGTASSTPSALLCTCSKEHVGAGTSSVLPGLVRGGGRSSWEAGRWAVGEGTRSARRPQTSHTFLPEGEVGVWSFLSNLEHSTHRDKMEGAWCQVFTQLICKELPGFSDAVKTEQTCNSCGCIFIRGVKFQCKSVWPR